MIDPSKSLRFWSKVDKSGECWNWTAGRNNHGYGRIQIVGLGVQFAHRVSWALTNGPIPKDRQVLHRCDNPPCVNPAHLFLGDRFTNMQDMAAKKRSVYQRRPEIAARGDSHWTRRTPNVVARGEADGNAKLTETAVRSIRQRAAAGETCVALSREFNVCDETVARVVRRVSWKHVA